LRSDGPLGVGNKDLFAVRSFEANTRIIFAQKERRKDSSSKGV